METREDKDKFLDLCKDGDLERVAQLLRQYPTLIKYRGKKGKYQQKNKGKK